MKLLDKDGLTYYTGKIKNELTDYVKNTDYATSSKGGVIKTGNALQVWANSGVPYASEITYANYGNQGANTFIGKATLENVITGKDLTTKSYVDGLVGDIQTLLDNLNTGSGV